MGAATQVHSGLSPGSRAGSSSALGRKEASWLPAQLGGLLILESNSTSRRSRRQLHKGTQGGGGGGNSKLKNRRFDALSRCSVKACGMSKHSQSLKGPKEEPQATADWARGGCERGQSGGRGTRPPP